MIILEIMAKLIGPLFSIAAHGTIGKAVTYSRRPTHNHARYQKKQKDRYTLARDLQRIKFGIASRIWANLTEEEKATLEAAL